MYLTKVLLWAAQVGLVIENHMGTHVSVTKYLVF